MGLHNLPAELLLMIMEAIDDTRALQSLLHASRQSRQLYRLSETTILKAVIRNSIEPEVLPCALAIAHAQPLSGSKFAVDDALQVAFIMRYFGGPPFAFPTSKEALVSLRGLCCRVAHFTDEYSTRAWNVLNGGDGAAGRPALTHSERTRFQRAFLGLELYCRLYPVPTSGTKPPALLVGYQGSSFFSKFEPWEIEEMSCVFCYYESVVTELMNTVKKDFVEQVRAAADAQSHGPPLSPSSKPDARPMHRDDDETRFDFGTWRLDILDSSKHWANMACLLSRRSDGIYRFTKARLEDLKPMLTAELCPTPASGSWTFFERMIDYEGAAVRWASACSTPVIPAGSSGPGPGFLLFRRAMGEQVLHIKGQGVLHYPLRERAYMFWDAERFQQNPAVRKSLEHARRTDMKTAEGRYRGGLKVEKCLKNVVLSWEDLLPIARQYDVPI